MKEIEILTEVMDTKDQALATLKAYESVAVKKTTDVYFFDPLRDDLHPEEDLKLRRSFRLRDKGGEISLTYKIDNFDKEDIWTYSDEHEINLDSFKETEQIINHLGLRELVRVENEKHIFKTSEYEIVFEDVKGLGYFLEVEKLKQVEDGEEGKVKENIREFIANLDIKFGNELNAGKPELMLRKEGFKN